MAVAVVDTSEAAGAKWPANVAPLFGTWRKHTRSDRDALAVGRERDLAVLLAHTPRPCVRELPMLSPGHAASPSPRFAASGHARNGGPAASSYDPVSVHIASLAEKRRLWWTNALINSLFIAAW